MPLRMIIEWDEEDGEARIVGLPRLKRDLRASGRVKALDFLNDAQAESTHLYNEIFSEKWD